MEDARRDGVHAEAPAQARDRPAEGRNAGLGAVPLVVGPRQRLRLPAEGGAQPRHRPAGTRVGSGRDADHGSVQVQLRHRVGLRLRLRARHDRRCELHLVAVGEGLHDEQRRKPEQDRVPEQQRQRPHRDERRACRRAGAGRSRPSDFSEEDELRLFPGGCGDEGRKVAAKCTEGWSRIQADQPSALDHAYYLELRDRSGFDYEGRGQSDRGLIGWAPGALIEYTDEIRGYGNFGGASPPRQHYIDSQPQPDYDCGNNEVEEHPEPAVLTDPRCQDAAFTTADGDSHFRDVGWIDNFWDESSPDGLW